MDPTQAERPATIRQCAILAGGRATRLGALAADLPKPLLPCGDRPFLAWLLRELSRFGVSEAVLLAGHLADRLAEALPAIAATLPRPMRLVLSREPVQAGTAGALFHARHLLDPRFLLVNGDSLLDANLARLLADAAADPPEVLGRLALHRLADAGRSGVVALTGECITAFLPRPATAAPGLISAGLYALDRQILDLIGPTGSLEADVLPGLAARGALRGTLLPGWFIDIGIPADLARAGAELPRRLRRPALFLDRDGVINQDLGYVGTRDRFHWLGDIRAAIRAASDAGRHVFVVTNQSGIARGYYSEAQLAALHAWMIDEVRRAGGTIDDLRHCPDHPDRPGPWRKPAPGMLLDLLRVWQADAPGSAMLGDQPSDLAAAAAGVRGLLLSGENPAPQINFILCEANQEFVRC